MFLSENDLTEPFIALTVFCSVFMAALVVYWVHGTGTGLFRAAKSLQQAHAGKPRMICRCPGCLQDIFQQVKAAMSADLGFKEISVSCVDCHTRSVWLPIAQPPELSRYMLPQSYHWKRADVRREKRRTRPLRRHG